MENQFSYPLQSRTSNTIETDPVRTHLITATPFPSTILKLDASNFLIWKLQFLPILRGHKLDKFVLKDKPPFMQEIGALECEIDEEILNRYSSEQQLWILQDQLLQGWIVAAISPSIAGLVIGLETSRRRNFASKSKMSLLQMRIQLQNMKKGSDNIATYFLKMKSMADQMAAGGGSVSEEDLVSYIFGGLGPEYEMLIVSLQTRLTPPSFEDVKQHLLYYENRLETQNCAGMMDSIPYIANSSMNLVGSEQLHEKIGLQSNFKPNFTSQFTATQEHFLKNRNSLNDSTNFLTNGSNSSVLATHVSNAPHDFNVPKFKSKNKFRNGRL
nr:uncharacterized protein LOC125424101 [Ziziphus jujuba var. spinosa]